MDNFERSARWGITGGENVLKLRNALKISSSFLKESILFILNLDYAEEDEEDE